MLWLFLVIEILALHLAVTWQTDWFSFCLSRPRRASPGAEIGHGPVPVLHVRVPARHHGFVRGERGGVRLRGQNLPALPGHIGGLPLGARG